MGKCPELGVHCPCLLGEGQGATRESCAPRLEGPHSTERLCISAGPLKSLLMDPANVLWMPVLCYRCGSNHTDDWPLIGREILSELASPTSPCVGGRLKGKSALWAEPGSSAHSCLFSPLREAKGKRSMGRAGSILW